MTLDDLAELTRRIIGQDSPDKHLPTLCLPERKIIRELEGVDGDIESAAMEWAEELIEGDEDYLLAFRISSTHFKVVGRIGKKSEESIFAAIQEKQKLCEAEAPHLAFRQLLRGNFFREIECDQRSACIHEGRHDDVDIVSVRILEEAQKGYHCEKH